MTRDELASWWLWFGDTECRGYSPLYDQICTAVAGDGELLDRLSTLPGHAQQPNMLLAAVHDRVLRGDAPDLAAIYDGTAADPVGPAFLRVALAAWQELVPVLEQRRTQTNEIGRVAVLVPALAAAELDGPLTVVDVGTSAGLTLLADRVLVDYGPLGRVGPVESPVQVRCEVLHGTPPIRPTHVAARLGLDRRPLDPTDADDGRWLLACTWPDTDRLERTRAALALARQMPCDLRCGDAVEDLPALLAGCEGPLAVTTTWALAYLSDADRRAVAALLAEASRHRPVAWISAEAPSVVEALPAADAPHVEGSSPSVVGLVRYERGAMASAQVLGHAHPHGAWLWWHAG